MKPARQSARSQREASERRAESEGGGKLSLLGRRCSRRRGRGAGLFGEVEAAVPAQDVRARVALARSRCRGELRLDVVVVFVALHLGDQTRFPRLYGALRVQLCAAVVFDGAVDDEIAGTALLAVLSVEVLLVMVLTKVQLYAGM